jgi:hypothetical protein
LPDDQKPTDQQTQTPPAAPAFDYDALAGQVADKLKDTFKQAPQPPQRPMAPQPPVQQVQDPMADILRPYIEPVARAAQIAADSADDAAEFYSSHGDLEKDERLEIERRFKSLKAQGLPLKREDIYNHYVGENVDKVVEKRMKKRDEAITKARDAATVGSGSPDRGPAQVQDARALPIEQLEKALAGQSF